MEHGGLSHLWATIPQYTIHVRYMDISQSPVRFWAFQKTKTVLSGKRDLFQGSFAKLNYLLYSGGINCHKPIKSCRIFRYILFAHFSCFLNRNAIKSGCFITKTVKHSAHDIYCPKLWCFATRNWWKNSAYETKKEQEDHNSGVWKMDKI